MIVMKFGGSSVRDAEMITRVVDIAADRVSRGVLLVSSACGTTTDRLVTLGGLAAGGDEVAVEREREAILDEHLAMLAELATGDRADAARNGIKRLGDDLATLLQGILLVGDLSPRSSDALLGFGERLSTLIITASALTRGIPATLLDSSRLIRTDDSFGRARPDLTASRRLIAEAVPRRTGHLYIAQGFIGSRPDGTVTTLGRGGSDFSATIYGAALDAEQVEIWTDVDGIMTADPRLIPDARTVSEISYNEAAELAYFGAKVVHPSTMIPAVESGIPVLVCNTTNPDGPRTRISATTTRPDLRAIAGRRGVTIVSLHSSRMLNASGFLSSMFEVFARHNVSVDLIATSEVSVSVSIDAGSPSPAMIRELEALGRVTVDTDKAVLSLVGEGRWKDPHLIRDVFDALIGPGNDARGNVEHEEVEMISLGSSDTNLSVVVPQSAYEALMSRLHARFFDARHPR